VARQIKDFTQLDQGEFVAGQPVQEQPVQGQPVQELPVQRPAEECRISVVIPRSRIYKRELDKKVLVRTSFYIRPDQVEKLKNEARARNPRSNMSQLLQDLIDDHL